ncbi:hypothetical protein PIB30_084257 [Stylosanthes scabra]|uniref:Uncharacterized protein n=1 Tax=Stylosanthes scabra TaxID=79078 RepID=A0ABU6WSB5_9FABA|nr:hypothetical protein [Stylosanthes scabra]
MPERKYMTRRGGSSQRGSFYHRGGYKSRNSIPSFFLPHTQINRPNLIPVQTTHHFFETFSQPSLMSTRPPPMARKTMVHRRLGRTTSPSSEYEPSPPPSQRGPRRRVASPELEPSPPGSSRGKRPLVEEEDSPPSPPAQPRRHGISSLLNLSEPPEPIILEPNSFKFSYENEPKMPFDPLCFLNHTNYAFYKFNVFPPHYSLVFSVY